MECPTPCPVCGEIVDLHDMVSVAGNQLVCESCVCVECEGSGECGDCYGSRHCDHCGRECIDCNGEGSCRMCSGSGVDLNGAAGGRGG